MSNLHIFENQSELVNYIDSQYQEPFVSTVSGEGSTVSVKYNLRPEEKPSVEEMPLTFVITKVGYIKWVASDENYTKTIEYSKDNGVTWNSITSTTEGVSFRVNAGEVIQFRGDNSTYGQSVTQYNSFDSSDCEFNLMGNIMSLIDSVNYATATTLGASYTFYSLFENCTGLRDTSDFVLPATSLTNSCYAYMFYGCSNLGKSATLGNIEDLYYTVPTAKTVTLPSLPATTLAQSCYKSMFAGCTEITTAPALEAQTLVESCYEGMFSGCSSLNCIKMFATNISATSATTNWVYGVAPTGTFYKSPKLDTIEKNSVNGIPVGWVVEGDFNGLTFEILTAGTINWSSRHSAVTRTIEYSKDECKTWNSITATTSGVTIPVEVGDVVYFRGNNTAYATTDARFCTFSGSTCGFKVKGNIMSLIDSVNYETLYTLPADYTFVGLFNNCTGLTDASSLILPATSVTNYGYALLFKQCYHLYHGPQLPATVLGTYCYQDTFSTCWKLQEAPALPAQTLTDSCYRGMFQSCTALTTAPDLLAETLVDNCYRFMFNGSSHLNYIKMTAKSGITATDCFKNWVSGVSATGTFVKDKDVTNIPVNSVNGIPVGWTVIEYDFDKMNPLLFNITSPGNIVWKTSDSSLAKTIEYSKDNGNTWTAITSTTDGVQIPVVSGDTVMFRGNNANYSNGTVYNGFGGSTCSFVARGNIMSLINSENFSGLTTYQSANTFNSLFKDCYGLTSANNLKMPATTLTSACCMSMFSECTGLTSAPALPATTMDYHCYSAYTSMFLNCSSLTSAPALPATSLTEYCYYQMFKGCTSLTTAPELPATALYMDCYVSMFDGCSSLVNAPDLPATYLASQCYYGMFKGCTSLTTAPKISATTFDVRSCYSMFEGCTSLVTVPSLSATTLNQQCCIAMFKGCTSLVKAPDLPATHLEMSCYDEMFYGCTSLNYIKCLATQLAPYSTSNWVYGVATAGTFVKASEMTGWTVDSVNGIPVGWTAVNDGPQDYLAFTALEDGTFSFSTNDLQYSLDSGTTWTTLTAGSSTPTVSSGSTIMWKQTGLTPNSSNGIGTFSSTGNFNVYGNVMSLYYGDNFVNQTDLTGKNYAFKDLFSNCTGLLSSENLILPATTLANYCYQNMFNGCTSLTTAPELPATTLATYCYRSMFQGCTNLTTAPVLSATTLANYCYQNMFNGCTSLTTAPELPATTLAIGCYYSMFQGCTGLTTAPVLSATTLANECYNSMFRGCTSLTTAPALPATTLANSCYYWMFKNCTSLTTAPALPATTLVDYCYYSMFQGCTGLTTAPVLSATTLATYCYIGMFQDCTSLTTAPELPATTLAPYCYRSMFQGCTALTTAPELPATTLANECYYSMFYGCTNLNYIKCLATNISASNCTSNWVDGVAATGTFIKEPSMTGWTVDSVNGIPSGWTVQDDYQPTVPIGSVCYYNTSAQHLKFCDVSDYDSNDGPAVGVVVVPNNCTPDGTVRIMALNGVTSGGTTAVTEQYMAWGGYGTDTGLPNLTKVPTWSNSEGSTSGNSGTGYVASDNFNQVACYGNSSVFYQGSTPYIPPILTQNDEPNPDCLVEILSGTTNVNALCDFDGAGNTAALVALGSSYVAASACSMYSVDGLTSGWYLPACGELVYIYPKFTVLQSTINTLGGIQLLNNQPYLTSSEYYSTLVLVVGNGNVSSFGKSIPNAYVRPFAKITLDAQSF